jgi:hypothetical protein
LGLLTAIATERFEESALLREMRMVLALVALFSVKSVQKQEKRLVTRTVIAIFQELEVVVLVETAVEVPELVQVVKQ